MELQEALRGKRGAYATRESDDVTILVARVPTHSDWVTLSTYPSAVPELPQYSLSGQPVAAYDPMMFSDHSELINELRVTAYVIDDLARLAGDLGFTDWYPIPAERAHR